jgi:DNA helicase IV
LRGEVSEQLSRIRRTRAEGTHANRTERDALARFYENRVAQLAAVDDRLCFGRLDLTEGRQRYVGRIGLADEERRQLLVDWRAPAARPFYQATGADPGEVVRRRHLITRRREVIGVEDEVLDLDALDEHDRAQLSGEGALLAAVNAPRTGRMGDIVATIQAEQDRIIRADYRGVMVVQGGPGTGKTAVALHRAAYLLYTHRQRLERSGVLLVGPSPVFLRYIEQVLPSLGETGVVMVTPGELFPGMRADVDDEPAVAKLKGDQRMAKVIAAAVSARQRVPAEPQHLNVDGQTVVLTPQAVAASRTRARRSRKPHNQARVVFVMEMLDHLARELAGRLGRAAGVDVSDDDFADLVGQLRDARDVRVAINLAWLPITPERLLADLYADPRRLAEAAPSLTPAERALLYRERGASWTVSDVPLLDEAAELLGEDDEAARSEARRNAQEREAELRYAQHVLETTGVAELMPAEVLVDRYAGAGPVLTAAERAAGDRTWAYGHIVVDEAQELSPMMWRLLMRRCPSRSMTVVGDVAQTGSIAGAESWGAVLEPYVDDRWAEEQLTVNYRTPARIMDLAVNVAKAGGIDVVVPASVREGDWAPRVEQIDRIASIGPLVRTERRALPEGRLAVVATRADRELVFALVRAALPEEEVSGPEGDAAVSVLTARECKGLEFDGVVVVEPSAIVAESPRGINDLYVALTRPTQRLLVAHTEDLPPGF